MTTMFKKYGYEPTVGDGISGSDVLLKHDLVGGSAASRAFGPDKAVGEFVFQPSSPDAAEDQGVLMGYVFDPATGHSELRVLDAGTLEDVASVALPGRVPTGFHGNWLPVS